MSLVLGVYFFPFQHVRDLPEFAYLVSCCLVSVASVIRNPGLPPLVIWLLFILNGALVLIRWTLPVAGLLLSIGMLLILP